MKLRTWAMIELAASIDSDDPIEEIDAIALVLADVASSSAVDAATSFLLRPNRPPRRTRIVCRFKSKRKIIPAVIPSSGPIECGSSAVLRAKEKYFPGPSHRLSRCRPARHRRQRTSFPSSRRRHCNFLPRAFAACRVTLSSWSSSGAAVTTSTHTAVVTFPE